MKKLPNHKTVFIALFFSLAIIQHSKLSGQDLNPTQWSHLKGYWEFQDSNNLLHATVGNDLILYGTHSVIAGPDYGDTAVRIAIGSYYKNYHGMAPNGGGDSVNRYTLMYDFKILSLNNWHTFHQIDTTNSNDGECFIRPNSSSTPGAIGVGYTGYSVTTVSPYKWYRLVISVNIDHYYRYYLNGNLIHEGDTDDLYIDDRFALTPAILFFADNNQEDDTIDIASMAIFDTCLTAAQVATIGTIDPCVLNPAVATLGNDTAFCEGGTAQLIAPSGFNKYIWSGIEGGQVYYVDQTETVDLVVEDARGCQSIADTMNITVYNRPVLNLGPDTSFCMGNSKFLDLGSGFTTYQWSDNYAGQSRTVSSSDTLWAKVQESIHQCWSLADTIQIKVNNLPVVILGNDTSFCEYNSVTLDAGSNFKNYYWSNGQSTQKQTISSSQILSVYVRDFNNCLSEPDSIQINVMSIPVINLGNDTILCRGDSVVLDAGNGFTSYWWSNGFNKSKQAIYNSSTIKARVQDALSGCWSKDESILITVHELPIKTLGQDQQFCEGSSAILDVGSYFNNYIWSNGFSGKLQFVYKTDTISLTVQDPTSGCWSIPDTVILSMIPSPFAALGNDSSLCKGDSILLDAGANFSSYLWSDGKKSQTRLLKSTKTLWVQVKDSNLCTSPRDSISIIFNSLPQINLEIDTAICDKEEIFVDAGSEFTSWHWSDGYDKQSRTINSSTLLAIFVVDTNGCKSNIDTINLLVHPLPQPKLGNDTLISLNDTFLLSTSTPFQTYFWNDGSDSSLLEIIAKDKGVGTYEYWVIVSDNKGCSNSDTISIRIYDPVSMKELEDFKFKIYPVPTKNRLFIEFDEALTGKTEISLMDLSAKILFTNSVGENRNKTELDISSFAAGVYLLQISNSSASAIVRIVKN